MAFTYHIALTGTAYTEFIPSTNPRLTFQESANEIFLRPTIEDIKISALKNPVLYGQLAAKFFDTDQFANLIKFAIRRDGTDEYFFRSSISDAKHDPDRKIFIFSPEPDDVCQSIINLREQPYDIHLQLLSGSLAPYQLSTAEFVNVDFTAFDDNAGDVTYSNTTGGLVFARQAFSSDITTVGDKVKIVIKDLSYTNIPIAITMVDSSFNDISNAVSINANGIYTLTLTGASPAHVQISLGLNGTGSFTYELYYYSTDVITPGYGLGDIINFLLGTGFMNLGITMRSTYLFNDPLPPEAPAAISTFITAHPTYNYASGAVNLFNGLFLCAIDGLTTADAENYDITMQAITDFLRIKLRAYWYIDTEGYMRIEHEGFFRQMAAQIDLTSATFAKFKPEVDRELLSYDKSDVYRKIQYKENNEGNADFIADPILYDISKTSPKTKDLTTDISTDVQWIIDNPGDASANGFLLVITEALTRAIPLFGASRTAGVYLQNQALSWDALFPVYWQYFAEADTADINNGSTLTPDHIKEYLRQTGIKFYYNGVINWYQPVTLLRGKGWLTKYELDLDTGFYTIDVGFDPGVNSRSITADSMEVTADSSLTVD